MGDELASCPGKDDREQQNALVNETGELLPAREHSTHRENAEAEFGPNNPSSYPPSEAVSSDAVLHPTPARFHVMATQLGAGT